MRNRYILAFDLVLIEVAVFCAFALRLGWFFDTNLPAFELFAIAALLVKPPVFFTFGMYREYWRYASVRELVAVVLAVSSASIALTIVVIIAVLSARLPGFPRSVVLLDWLLTLMFAGGVRLSVRIIGESMSQRGRTSTGDSSRRVLVVGAGDAGVLVVREMQRNPQLHLAPLGFLDDDGAKIGKQIHGLRVFGRSDDLERVVRDQRVDEVVIAMPRAAGSVVRAVAEQCRRAGVVSRTMPGVFELLDGNISVSRLRRVEIADLLRREPVETGQSSAGYLVGKRVLVTGAGGSIGFELCRQIAHAKPSSVVLLGHGENSVFEAEAELTRTFAGIQFASVIVDIRDRDRLLRVFERFKPHVVFHAAAHKHVSLMEANVEEAITNNVFGTINVLDATLFVGAQRFVMISTDKAVSPRGIMGASKRLAEMVVQESARRSGRPLSVVRFGNVLGSRGSVVPILTKQIEQGGPLTITHPEMTRFFMTIPEAVHLVVEAGSMGQGVFVLNMGQPVRIVELAEDLIRLSGLSPDEIAIQYTGVRPGERLHESLWDQDATVQPTHNPDVKRVVERDLLSDEALAAAIRRLRGAVEAGDALTIRMVLADVLPSFVAADPSHSPA
ncbi:MAG TPA: nucleoside-diphosphate sugar epimerase/dehydratase [Vicinamibacterales bacterium]